MSLPRKPVTLPREPAIDFVKRLHGGTLRGTVNLPLYSGKEREDGALILNTGMLPVDFGKLASVPERLAAAADVPHPGPCGYAGNTPEGAPVQLDLYKDLSVSNPSLRVCVRTTMDLQAVAAAQDMERDKARMERGMTPLQTGDPRKDMRNPALGRLNVAMRSNVSGRGYPGMNRESLCKSVAKAAAQNYLMNASKKDPSKGMVTKDSIESVASLFAKEYKNFATEYADKSCPGVKGRDGNLIAGTGFGSLSSMGLSPVTLDDGSFAIVARDADKAAARREGVAAFSKAFNLHMQQVAHDAFESGSVERSLAARMSILGHTVGKSIPVGYGAVGVTASGQEVDLPVVSEIRLAMVQPTMEFQAGCYANSLTTNVLCATHMNDLTPEEIYGREILQNTQTIMSYFDDAGGGPNGPSGPGTPGNPGGGPDGGLDRFIAEDDSRKSDKGFELEL